MARKLWRTRHGEVIHAPQIIPVAVYLTCHPWLGIDELDEEFVQCTNNNGQPCPEPKGFSRWLYYKCPEHGGPSHEERTNTVKKKKAAGTHVEVREEKGEKRGDWHGSICEVM
ncbi:hypothetical protein T440DRAFT_505569 [Plenodomus tracheiphilus IPT5]|uniref:Uncharacterized protein n=1 Tax=Plenodomus tracheiphilus IPT5 TaxID=1408161 RepID=A0A6A7BEU0_9PLEO|nr:hypothetical protein T440DRAFT_505569 [Plenodomus tracheiphilus IPT5]